MKALVEGYVNGNMCCFSRLVAALHSSYQLASVLLKTGSQVEQVSTKQLLEKGINCMLVISFKSAKATCHSPSWHALMAALKPARLGGLVNIHSFDCWWLMFFGRHCILATDLITMLHTAQAMQSFLPFIACSTCTDEGVVAYDIARHLSNNRHQGLYEGNKV